MSEVDLSGSSAITGLIDADTIIYLVAYNNRDLDDVDKVLAETDQFITNILVKVQARQYAGFTSPKHTFRHDIAKHRPYKGKRPESPEWLKKWKPSIVNQMFTKWEFIEAPNQMEADDAVSILQTSMVNSVICSPDKDLKQIPGNHYDYRTDKREYISPEEGEWRRYYQMLIGDTSDNICGIPRMGDKKARELLGNGEQDLHILVRDEYYKYYGSYYGELIFAETYGLIGMLTSPCYLIGLTPHIKVFDLDSASPSPYLSTKESEELPNPFEQ